jgi:hypothetical protein
MPAHETVYVWARENEETASRIALARKLGGDAIAQRARLTLRGKGPEAGGESTGDVIRDKAIAEYDLKLLARWFPKEYGENVQLRHADANGQKLDTAPLLAELMTIVGDAKDVTPSPAPDSKKPA